MELEFFVPPRLERRARKAAIKSEFNEIWEFMEKYGMAGWYYYLGNTDLEKMNKDLEEIDNDVDYVLSFGTGGSYQGIESLLQFSEKKDRFIFIGPSLDSDEINEIIKKIQGKKVGFTIISKSGTTLEILIFLNVFQEFIKKSQWICVITSNHNFSKFLNENFSEVPTIKSFEIKDDIGGRFSIVSNMGIVIAYLADLNYQEFLDGFLFARQQLENEESFMSLERGLIRSYLFEQGKVLENLSTNYKKIIPTLKWAKQLWSESNGKEFKSMFVSVGFYPEDAHSVGQIWKEGPRRFTETFFIIEKNNDLVFNNSLALNGLKINKKSLNQLNDDFIQAIIEDRFECGIPCMVYRMKEFSLYEWGQLVFSEMVGVVMEAYMLGVNPFNQPGVESYKNKVKKRIL